MEISVCHSCRAKAFQPISADGEFSLWQCSSCGVRRYQCPRCDGQGWLIRVRVRGGDAEMYVCEECEATFEIALPSRQAFRDFQDWLTSIGKQPAWSSVEEIHEQAA
jgi:transcription elongation factor Elf1